MKFVATILDRALVDLRISQLVTFRSKENEIHMNNIPECNSCETVWYYQISKVMVSDSSESEPNNQSTLTTIGRYLVGTHTEGF